MRGSPPKNNAATSDEWDLDALLAKKRLDPRPVTLGGHSYKVRRNLRAKEIDAFWAVLNKNDPEQDAAGFAILLGDCDEDGVYDQAEAQRFVDYADSLPLEHRNLVVRKFVVAAGLRKPGDYPDDEGVASGESKAS